MHDPLPSYSVRVSSRARHVRLTVHPRDGLVVVVPQGWRGDPADVVASRREWALHHLARFETMRPDGGEGEDSAAVPERIELRAAGVTLAVEVSARPGTRCRARVLGDTLVVEAPHGDSAGARRALDRWLSLTARAVLAPLLQDQANRTGLAYGSLAVTRARTRWGSCSSAGRIMLNRNLVFLPRELVDSLILHELAHTEVLDHSPAFYRVLERIDPDARAHRCVMRDAWRYVPAWAETGPGRAN